MPIIAQSRDSKKKIKAALSRTRDMSLMSLAYCHVLLGRLVCSGGTSSVDSCWSPESCCGFNFSFALNVF